MCLCACLCVYVCTCVHACVYVCYIPCLYGLCMCMCFVCASVYICGFSGTHKVNTSILFDREVNSGSEEQGIAGE